METQTQRRFNKKAPTTVGGSATQSTTSIPWIQPNLCYQYYNTIINSLLTVSVKN